MKGKTIQIYLPDNGNPTSIREATINNRKINAILFPRTKMLEIAKRPSVNNPGIYFLLANKEGSKPKVYIGKSEDCLDRVKDHTNKEFWTHCILVIRQTPEKGEGYTATDISFLEHYCLLKVREFDRYDSKENIQSPKKLSISESTKSDLLEDFETIKTLLTFLGYPLLESLRKDTKQILICKNSEGVAEGEVLDEGFLIYKGGKCSNSKNTTEGFKWVLKLKEDLKSSKILKQENKFLVFQKDHIFSSISAAAGMVLGRSSNGWEDWKCKETGKTAKEIYRS